MASCSRRLARSIKSQCRTLGNNEDLSSSIFKALSVPRRPRPEWNSLGVNLRRSPLMRANLDVEHTPEAINQVRGARIRQHRILSRNVGCQKYQYDHPSGDKGAGRPQGHSRDSPGHRDTTGTADGTPAGNRRTPVKRNICLDFAPATEGSFLSPAHAASSRPLARTNETLSWSGDSVPLRSHLPASDNFDHALAQERKKRKKNKPTTHTQGACWRPISINEVSNANFRRTTWRPTPPLERKPSTDKLQRQRHQTPQNIAVRPLS